ncbi:MAG: DUF4250 domain-containing protein [Bacilli bacterium]|nr:DUF4250 domain-containing protein [Acholeplasmataceae bacterium]MDY2902726.1 DUF4250 domain-containing protein [Bacilli bacterium]
MVIKDPNILLSVINTKLRDFYSSLDELCEKEDENREEIIKILQKIGCYYDETTNQFK